MKKILIIAIITTIFLAVLKMCGVIDVSYSSVCFPLIFIVSVVIAGYMRYRVWFMNEGARLADEVWDIQRSSDGVWDRRLKTMQDEKVRDQLIQPYRMSGVKYFGKLYDMGIFYQTVNKGVGWCREVDGEAWLYIRLADSGRWCKFRRATTAEIDGAYESALPNDEQVTLLKTAITVK
jgi:hypothetical protein